MKKIVFPLFVSLLCLVIAATAQTRSVSGKVTDATGNPFPFVTVSVKGTKTAVSADNNGAFTIKAKTGDVLSVSGVGIEKQEIKISDAGLVNVIAQRSTANLNEVIVTTALGVQRQAKELGYSATTVQAKDLVVAKPISVINGLTGKVAGLQINTVNNGVFAPTRVTLRGNRSLTGNNQPLVVVDGAIFYNDISTLNPDDISDINVLKGSSASAVYGSDASNGVLIITTKKGTRGKPSITYSSTVQFETVSYLPNFQDKFGSNGGEVFINDFHDLSTYVPYENQNYGPLYNGAIVPLGRPLSDGSLLKIPYSPVKNQKRDFFDVGITTQNSFSYTAGDDNSRFFMSLQDVNTKGTMPHDVGRRDVFRVGGSKTYGIFSANYSLSYTYKKTDLTNTGTVYDNVMNVAAHVPLKTLADWRNNKYADLNGFYDDYEDNPYWDIDNYRNKTTDNNLTANVQFNLKPTKWLNLSYRLALTNLSSKYEYNGGVKAFSSYASTNKTVIYSNRAGTGFDTVSESPKYVTAFPAPAGYTSANNTNYLLTSDFVASIDKNLSKDFNLKASLGTTYINNQRTGISVSAASLVVPVYNINNISGIPTTGGGNYYQEARKLGLFGEATVAFRNYAFVHGSYRGDIDSRLSKDNRFIPYYDVDASLVLSEMIPSLASKTLTFIKLRGAHSVTGNASALGNGSQYIAGGAYTINPTYNVAGGFPFGSLGGYSLNTTIANPNIKPEQVTENEVGLELGFLNRVQLTIAAYQADLKDGIVTANTASSTGFFNALVNAANTTTRGIETELKGTLIRNKNVIWNVGINYTHTESKVISINGGVQSLGIGGGNANAFAVVGQPYPVIQSRDWVRDPQGHVIVDAVTGNPTRASNLTVLGNATPKDIFGFSSNVTWKSFTFTVTADYRGGYKIFNSQGQQSDFTGVSQTSAASGRQRFVFPNSVIDQGGGKYAANNTTTTDDGNFNFFPGLYRSVGANYIISAAAWKLREVAISYEIPRKFFAATKIVQRATFTVSGRNLLMFRPKTNQWTDPEFSEDTGNGVGRTSTGQAPPTRIFSATLAVTF